MKLCVFSALMLCGVMAFPFNSSAKDKNNNDSNESAEVKNKDEYVFKHKEPVTGLANNDYMSLGIGGNKVMMMRGDLLSKYGDEIVDVALNPSGVNYAVLTSTKKGLELSVFNPLKLDDVIYKLNSKKLGEPRAVTYTPDAQRILIATTQGVKVLDARSFIILEEFEVPFVPTEMKVSKNNNFLAISDGKNVAVYNFENKNLRKKWKEDVEVSAINFSRDGSEFSILTNDGVVNFYDTINFMPVRSIEDVGDGLDGDYNFDGKYMAFVINPNNISVINLLDNEDKIDIPVESGGVSNVGFNLDGKNKTILIYNADASIRGNRLNSLEPFYGKLIADEVNELMNEWLKMMPGESMEDYRARISNENRTKQMRLFEAEVSTKYANNLLEMSSISLGKYDRVSNLLEIELGNMPNIYLAVPENEVSAFSDVNQLAFSDMKYGIMPNDNFELVYAKIHNNSNGNDYIYNNINRAPLKFLESDADLVSIEVIQQQQMEELRLQELREKVMEEAKKQNVISDHTNITVDSRIIPDYDADGKKILNYQVNFSYEVEPGFSVQEDFGPGKYEISESGAARSMLSIVKQAFEGDLAQYLIPGKKLRVKVSGNADGTPIARRIAYSGVYGDIENEPVYKNGKLTGISVNKKDGISENEQLAFLRAYGVTNYLNENVSSLKDLKTDYEYHIEVLEEKGGEFRRITAEFTIIDAF